MWGKRVYDLIETLWNVKMAVTDTSSFVTGFNRDIVECKVDVDVYDSDANARFNRDIVECKDRSSPSSNSGAIRFNRDIVECKDDKHGIC